MSQPSASPRIARKDYDAFRILLRGDPEIPDSYEQWQTLCLMRDVKRVNSGHSIQAVPVEPEEFVAYCRACGREPTGAMLVAFAAVKAGRS